VRVRVRVRVAVELGVAEQEEDQRVAGGLGSEELAQQEVVGQTAGVTGEDEVRRCHREVEAGVLGAELEVEVGEDLEGCGGGEVWGEAVEEGFEGVRAAHGR